MSCCSINGGGGTQPFGKGRAVTAAASNLSTGGGRATTKPFPRQRYLYKDGPALWPPAQPGSLPRQASNYWSYKTRECPLDCASGFVGVLQPDNTIRCTFAGLPTCEGRVDRSGNIDVQWRRRQQTIDNQRGRNGRRSVARSRKLVQPRCRCARAAFL